MVLPGGDFCDEFVALLDAAVETLATEYTDLDHIEPARVLWGVMELEALKDAMRLRGGEGLVERAGGMGREVVEHDANELGLGVIEIDELAHASGEVASGSLVGDLDLAPGPVRIEEDEQVGRALAAIFTVIALAPTGAAGIGGRTSPMSWVGLSSKQTTDRSGSGTSA